MLYLGATANDLVMKFELDRPDVRHAVGVAAVVAEDLLHRFLGAAELEERLRCGRMLGECGDPRVGVGLGPLLVGIDLELEVLGLRLAVDLDGRSLYLPAGSTLSPTSPTFVVTTP